MPALLFSKSAILEAESRLLHRRSWMPVAEISYFSPMRQNPRFHGCGECALRMMGTPCFLLEQAAWRRAQSLSRIKFRTWVRLGPVSWKEKTPLSTPGEEAWRNVPYVNFNRDDRQVKLNANPDDNSNDNLAVPCFRESPSRSRSSLRSGIAFYAIDFDHPPSIRPTS